MLPEEKKEEIKKGLSSNAEMVNYIKPHGICLGCMINCHTDHEIYELYTKVDFRCDCGNSQMPFSCSLFDEKEYINEWNFYN